MKKKSYFILGNTPIYSEGEWHNNTGPSYVINTRIKYERGVCCFKFIKQKDSFIFSPENLGDDIELDMSSLVRLKIFLISNCKIGSLLHIGSTSLIVNKKLQRNCYVKKDRDDRFSVIIDNREQRSFVLNGSDILVFSELVKQCITILSTMQGNYDLKNMYSTKDIWKPPKEMESIQSKFKVVFNENTTGVPPPVDYNNPPSNVTNTVVPQPPKF